MAKRKKAMTPTYLSSENLALSPLPTTKLQQAEKQLIPCDIAFQRLQHERWITNWNPSHLHVARTYF